MKAKDFESYYSEAAPFAQPILLYLKNLILRQIPESNIEIKWNFPCFTLDNKMICSMAAHKQHCSFSFWNAEGMTDPHQVLYPIGSTGMGQLGKIKSLEDLPSEEILIDLIDEAKKLHLSDYKKKKIENSKELILEIPEALTNALHSNPECWQQFKSMSISCQKEYIQWIIDAKKEETKLNRIQKAIEMIRLGRDKNWKYKK
jgi:uncharacterized protein YdeI (YjbR/CyaY-like superfamily)